MRAQSSAEKSYQTSEPTTGSPTKVMPSKGMHMLLRTVLIAPSTPTSQSAVTEKSSSQTFGCFLVDEDSVLAAGDFDMSKLNVVYISPMDAIRVEISLSPEQIQDAP
jgi:hypothetical protein